MKIRIFLAIALMVSGSAFAQEQHFDVEFGYEDGGLIFESDVMGIDAAGVFEADFEVTNMDGSQSTEDPGFASNFTEDGEMFEVANGDSIFVNVNQSATLGSYLTYFNPLTGSFEGTSAQMFIEDNSPGSSDLVISNGGLAGDLSQFVVTSTGAEIDTHVDFTLSGGETFGETAPAGIYGLLLNIESDNLSGQLTSGDTSESFWVLFNNGLDEEDFEAGVDNFIVVPEPSCAILLPIALAAMLRRKRS